jgi:hypothetical protein
MGKCTVRDLLFLTLLFVVSSFKKAVSSLADSDGLAGSKGPTTCRGTVDDKLSSFSNYGSAVNIAAPGGKP